MGSWAGFALAVLTLIGWLWGPGLIALRGYGFRRTALFGLAPLVSTAFLSTSGIILSALNISWTLISAALAVVTLTVLTSLIALILRRWLVLPQASVRPESLGKPVYVAVIAASLALATMTLWGIHEPAAFSQTFDNVFHLNATQFILQSHEASPFTLAEVSDHDGQVDFYPAAWHTLASVAVLSTGVSIPVAFNALAVLVVVAVWPLGVLLLARTLWPQRTHAVVGAVLVSAALPTFPLLFLHFGVLYPNLLGFSLLPAGLSVLLRSVTGLAPLASETRPAAGLAALVGLGAMGLAHPSAVLTAVVFTAVAVIAQIVQHQIARTRSEYSPWSRGGWPGAALRIAVITAGVWWLWKSVRPDAAAAVWKPTQTPGQAIGEVLTNSQWGRDIAVVASVLAIVGFVALWRAGEYALPWAALLMGWAFVVVSSFAEGDLRDFVGGVFYNDSFRFAAASAVPVVLLSGYGLGWVLDLVAAAGWGRVGVGIVATVLSLGGLWSMQESVHAVRASFALNDRSPLVDTDEAQLLSRLDDYTEADERLIVNPGTGAALAYALSDREVVGAAVQFTDDEAEAYVRQHLSEGRTPQLCAALAAADIDYVLDFGTRQVNDEHRRYAGLENLDTTEVQTVAQVGDARLLRITVCE